MMHQLDDRRRRQSLVYVGGALSPARAGGELDDLVTSLVHDGALLARLGARSSDLE